MWLLGVEIIIIRWLVRVREGEGDRVGVVEFELDFSGGIYGKISGISR